MQMQICFVRSDVARLKVCLNSYLQKNELHLKILGLKGAKYFHVVNEQT